MLHLKLCRTTNFPSLVLNIQSNNINSNNTPFPAFINLFLECKIFKETFKMLLFNLQLISNVYD